MTLASSTLEDGQRQLAAETLPSSREVPGKTNPEPPGAGAPSGKAVAVGVLVFCCVLWGWSFPTMQYASRAFDIYLIGHEHPATWETVGARALLNGWRFLIAGVLYALLTWRHQRGFSRADRLGGTVVGLLFGSGMLLQVAGLAWARPSVSGFLTSLAVVFAPLAQAWILRRRVGGTVWTAVALASAGVVLLAWPNPAAHGGLTAIPPLPLLGEVLTVLGCMVFTAQILVLDHYGQVADPRRLTSVMLLTCAALNLALAAGLTPRWLSDPGVLTGLVGDRTVWWSLGSLIVFSSVLAIPLMNTFQPRVSPAVASVVYCSEPLFAVLFSVMLGAEHLTAPTLAGGAAVLGAVLVVAAKSRTRAG